jgi:hypothetical protein
MRLPKASLPTFSRVTDTIRSQLAPEDCIIWTICSGVSKMVQSTEVLYLSENLFRMNFRM